MLKQGDAKMLEVPLRLATSFRRSTPRALVGSATQTPLSAPTAERYRVGEVGCQPQRITEGQKRFGERAVHAYDRRGSGAGCRSLVGVNVITPGDHDSRSGSAPKAIAGAHHESLSDGAGVLQPETCVGTKPIRRLTSIVSKQVVRLMRFPRRFPALGEARDQAVPGDPCARLAMHPPLRASARTREFRAAGRVSPVAILATRPLADADRVQPPGTRLRPETVGRTACTRWLRRTTARNLTKSSTLGRRPRRSGVGGVFEARFRGDFGPVADVLVIQLTS